MECGISRFGSSTDQGFRYQPFTVAGFTLELLCPTGDSGPIARFLAGRAPMTVLEQPHGVVRRRDDAAGRRHPLHGLDHGPGVGVQEGAVGDRAAGARPGGRLRRERGYTRAHRSLEASDHAGQLVSAQVPGHATPAAGYLSLQWRRDPKGREAGRDQHPARHSQLPTPSPGPRGRPVP